MTGVSVVCLGSSAGGLGALRDFFSHMDPTSGYAFVVIQHLEPRGPALTRDILTRITTMVVTTAENGQQVLPNQVYTIPPGAQLTIVNGHLVVAPRTESSGRHHPFDRFLKSLATDCGAGAIAVVLSGYDGDGSAGFIAIKAHGGVTYAQDGTAAVGEMPASAIATGSVDYVLNAIQIAEHIAHLRTLQGASGKPGNPSPSDSPSHRTLGPES